MDAASTTIDAKMLFRNVIECEREDNFHEATRSYKQALKLDPDVDKKITDVETASQSMDTYENVKSDDGKDEFFFQDLFSRFQRISGPQIFLPKHSQQTTHFSALIPELILYIFKEVISHDLRTLEECKAVCRDWYLCASHPGLWRQACSKWKNTECLIRMGLSKSEDESLTTAIIDTIQKIVDKFVSDPGRKSRKM